MTKKQIEALEWATDTAAKWLVDNSTEQQDARMVEANAAIEALKNQKPLVFTYQELSTVLAGLRLVQQKLESVREIMELAEMSHFADVECPSVEEIDALCERITCDCEMTGEVPHLIGRSAKIRIDQIASADLVEAVSTPNISPGVTASLRAEEAGSRQEADARIREFLAEHCNCGKGGPLGEHHAVTCPDHTPF